MKRSRSLRNCLCLALLALTSPLVAQNEPERTGARQRRNQQDWVVLFDGKTLEGWEQKNGTATYEVKDGAILGSTVEGSPNSFLCSKKDYSDFVLEFEVKVLRDDLNSGVQIRSHSRPEYRDGRVHGPQVEIENSPGRAGFIYGEATTGNWISPGPEDATTSAFKNGEWNQYRVRAAGPTIVTWINGQKIAETTHEEHTNPNDPGFIGLQVHSYRGEHPAQVMWRNIRIRELKNPNQAAGTN